MLWAYKIAVQPSSEKAYQDRGQAGDRERQEARVLGSELRQYQVAASHLGAQSPDANYIRQLASRSQEARRAGQADPHPSIWQRVLSMASELCHRYYDQPAIRSMGHGTTISGDGVTGDAPMLDKTLMMSCLIPRDSRVGLMPVLSRPHENCMEPEANTFAPLPAV